MFSALKVYGLGVSLLSTGLYQYRVGTHKANKPHLRQEASFIIQHTNYLVLRTPDDLSYDPFQPFDVWTIGQAHNFHAAGRYVGAPLFASAGCQVMEGGYDRDDRSISLGPWMAFRAALGLVDEDGRAIAAAAGTPFQYMLLTGVEARLAARGEASFVESYHRARPGSSGAAISALQQALFASADVGEESLTGYFDTATGFAALVASMRADGEYASPIVAFSPPQR